MTMANLIVRTSRPYLSNVFDSFRAFDDLMRWDPFSDATLSLRGLTTATFAPTFEVKETKDDYVFKADLPGIEDKDVDITVNGNTLTVSGKREAESRSESDRCHVVERSYGSFSRAFTLPEGANLENVKAELRSGVLTVVRQYHYGAAIDYDTIRVNSPLGVQLREYVNAHEPHRHHAAMGGS